MSLNVGDQIRLLLLQRVHDGHVSELWGFYFDDGKPIWHMANNALANLAEFGWLELIYPPNSGVWRQKDYGPDELVYGVHVGLTEAELTRTVALTELGMRELKELSERRQAVSTVVDR